MMQFPVDPCSFARPPPPGFSRFGSSSSCARQAVAHLPHPPPGVSRPRRVLLPSLCEVPAPPTLPKRKAPPVSPVAAAEKRQRLCSEYEDEIDSNLRAREKNAQERPLLDYLKAVQQDRVSPSARASLVRWMDAFVRCCDLADDTLHHAVAYLDRVLSVRPMKTHSGYELRLMGAAAVFMSAKYEDRSTVLKLDAHKIASCGEFATSKEVLDMERHMVAALGYQLGGPTAHTFVSHFTRHAEGEEQLQIQRMAQRIADQSLLNYASLGYLPSIVAASAICLANFALNPPEVLPWSTKMQELTGYSISDLAACVRAMYYFSQSLCNPGC